MNFFFAIPLVLGLIPAAALSQSAIDGTWKVDMDSYSPGKKPASYIVSAGKFECASCPGQPRIATDGRDHRVEGDLKHDTLAVKLPDERTVEAIGKKAGKVVSRVTLKVSADDQTLIRQSTENVNGRQSTNEIVYARAASGPAGSHSLSGSWRRIRYGKMSESLVTFRTENGMLSMSSPQGGGSYTAKLDGPMAPLKGDGSGNSVSVKMKDSRTLEEIAYRDGKPYLTTVMQVDAGGSRAKVTWTSEQARAWELKFMFAPDPDAATGTYTMTRQ